MFFLPGLINVFLILEATLTDINKTAGGPSLGHLNPGFTYCIFFFFWRVGVFCFVFFFGYWLGQKRGREKWISQRLWKNGPSQTNKQLMRLTWDEGTEEGYTQKE